MESHRAHSRAMGTMIKISGAVDRRDPDPTAPNDQTRAWIGMLTAQWTVDGVPRQAMAAILKVATGGGVMFTGWGPHVLCLSWIGDPPAPDIAQSVYDAVLHRGPYIGTIVATIEATARSSEQGSYRAVPRAAVR